MKEEVSICSKVVYLLSDLVVYIVVEMDPPEGYVARNGRWHMYKDDYAAIEAAFGEDRNDNDEEEEDDREPPVDPRGPMLPGRRMPWTNPRAQPEPADLPGTRRTYGQRWSGFSGNPFPIMPRPVRASQMTDYEVSRYLTNQLVGEPRDNMGWQLFRDKYPEWYTAEIYYGEMRLYSAFRTSLQRLETEARAPVFQSRRDIVLTNRQRIDGFDIPVRTPYTSNIPYDPLWVPVEGKNHLIHQTSPLPRIRQLLDSTHVNMWLRRLKNFPELLFGYTIGEKRGRLNTWDTVLDVLEDRFGIIVSHMTRVFLRQWGKDPNTDTFMNIAPGGGAREAYVAGVFEDDGNGLSLNRAGYIQKRYSLVDTVTIHPHYDIVDVFTALTVDPALVRIPGQKRWSRKNDECITWHFDHLFESNVPPERRFETNDNNFAWPYFQYSLKRQDQYEPTILSSMLSIVQVYVLEVIRMLANPVADPQLTQQNWKWTSHRLMMLGMIHVDLCETGDMGGTPLLATDPTIEVTARMRSLRNSSG